MRSSLLPGPVAAVSRLGMASAGPCLRLAPPPPPAITALCGVGLSSGASFFDAPLAPPPVAEPGPGPVEASRAPVGAARSDAASPARRAEAALLCTFTRQAIRAVGPED